MKRILLLLPLFAILLSSCSKEENNDPKELDLSGIWYVSSATPWDITEETVNTIETYNDEKPMPYNVRYELHKVSDSVYEYKVYTLVYPHPEDMCDEDYADIIDKIFDGVLPITGCRWMTSKEWNYALITENQITMNLYSKYPIKMEMLKLNNNTISFVNHDVYLDSEGTIKTDVFTTLSRSSNRVLPIGQYTFVHETDFRMP